MSEIPPYRINTTGAFNPASQRVKKSSEVGLELAGGFAVYVDTKSQKGTFRIQFDETRDAFRLTDESGKQYFAVLSGKKARFDNGIRVETFGIDFDKQTASSFQAFEVKASDLTAS